METKNIHVYDIECQSLALNSKFYIAGTRGDDGKHRLFYTLDSFVIHLNQLLREGAHLVCHNQTGFDLPYMAYSSPGFINTVAYYRDQIHDSLLISTLLFPNRFKHGLGSWAETFNLVKPDVDFREGNKDEMERRIRADLEINWALAMHFYDRGWPAHMEYYAGMQEFTPLAVDLIVSGIPYDEAAIKKAYGHYTMAASRRKHIVRRELGDIAISSTTQVNTALIEKYGKGLPLGELTPKTKKQNPLMSKKNKSYVVAEFPVLRNIYEAREFKGVGDYMNPNNEKKYFLSRVMRSPFHKADCIYPDMKILGTRTYRPTYSNPPLGQLSKQGREIVRAPKGWFMVGADVSGLENNIFAWLAKEWAGKADIQDYVDKGLCPKQLTIDAFDGLLDNLYVGPGETLKDSVKTINYAMMYGMAITTLLANLGLPDSYKGAVMEARENRFPGITQLQKILEGMIVNETIKNLFGQQCRTPAYCVLNTMLQSTGAEYSKRILGHWYEEMKSRYTCYPAVFNNDELQLVVEHDDLEELREEVEQTLRVAEKAFTEKSGFPLMARLDVKMGETWADSH